MVTMQHSGVTAHLSLSVLRSTETKVKAEFKRFDRRLSHLINHMKSRTFKGSVLATDTSDLSDRLGSLLSLESGIINEFRSYADKLNSAAQFLAGQKNVPPVGLPFEDHLITVKTSGTAGQIAALTDLLQRTASTVLIEVAAAEKRNAKAKSALGVCCQKAIAERERIAVEVYRRQLDQELARQEKSLRELHIDFRRDSVLRISDAITKGNFDREAELRRFEIFDLPILEEEVQSKLQTLKLKNLLDFREFEAASTIQADLLREVRATHIQAYKQRV
jgi:hypothetical protein